MTKEEKAKAYDEAVNKIKPLYEQAKRDGNPIWSTYEYLIPELAESEDESKDERIRKHIVEILKSLPGCYWYGQKEKDDSLSWLEKQKEQKQEWSEEDERRRDGIIQWLREYQKKFNPKYDSLSIESIESLIDWLKSLRPSWKPSKAHLSALLAVFNDPDNIGSQTCQLALTDLYEQLNKL